MRETAAAVHAHYGGAGTPSARMRRRAARHLPTARSGGRRPRANNQAKALLEMGARGAGFARVLVGRWPTAESRDSASDRYGPRNRRDGRFLRKAAPFKRSQASCETLAFPLSSRKERIGGAGFGDWVELAVASNVSNAHGSVTAAVCQLWGGPPSRREFRSDLPLAARPPEAMKKRA
jgi:hypothetical protein